MYTPLPVRTLVALIHGPGWGVAHPHELSLGYLRRLIEGGGHSWGDRFQDRTLPDSFTFVGDMFRNAGESPADKSQGASDEEPSSRPAGRKGG